MKTYIIHIKTDLGVKREPRSSAQNAFFIGQNPTFIINSVEKPDGSAAEKNLHFLQKIEKNLLTNNKISCKMFSVSKH